MIIETIKNCSNKITVDAGTGVKLNIPASTVPPSLFSSSENFKWTSEAIPNLPYIIVEYMEGMNIKNITWDFTAATTPKVKLFYSYDAATFNEFEYFSYSLTTTVHPTLSDELKEFEGNIIKSVVMNGVETLILFDKNSNKVSVKNTDLSLLKDLIKADRSVGTYLNWKYVFDYGDNQTALYSLSPSVVKMELIATTPFVMNKFEIFAELSISDIEIDLDLLSNNYFQPKYFEEYSFIPSMTKTFFTMLNYDGGANG